LTAVRFRLRPAFTSLPLTSKSLPAFTVTLLPAFRTLPATVFWLSCSRLLRVSLPAKTLMPLSSPSRPIPSRRLLCSLPADSAFLPAVMMTLRPPSNDRLLPASSTLPTTLTSCAALPVMLLPARITLAALVLAVSSRLLSCSLLKDTKSLLISTPKDFLWVLLSLKLSSCRATILRLPVSLVRPACSSTELSAATVLPATVRLLPDNNTASLPASIKLPICTVCACVSLRPLPVKPPKPDFFFSCTSRCSSVLAVIRMFSPAPTITSPPPCKVLPCNNTLRLSCRAILPSSLFSAAFTVTLPPAITALPTLVVCSVSSSLLLLRPNDFFFFSYS